MNQLEESISSIYSSPLYDFKENNYSPSEWIEYNRYIQQHVSINMFGDFKWNETTPYMREITDHLSPYSPVTHITLMKGVRTGGTFCLVHNGVPYMMSERPSNIMLLSANKELATKTMQGVDNGIDGCNVRYLIGKGSRVQSYSKGDTMEKKFFSGGFELFNFGGQSDDNMRQVTASVIIADEVDAFKFTSTKGGSFTDTMEDRASDAGERKKIIYISSPRLLETSVIYTKFLEGDQRIYLVPCPKCGKDIELVWNERNENNTRYGVIFDVINGEVDKKSVRYRCGKCENDFLESKYKREMLINGFWKPQIERINKTNVSYRISALYAPVVMDGWSDFAVRWQKAHPRDGIKDNAKVQTFTNSIMGLPYKTEGITIKSTKLQGNRRDYKVGECPFELSKKDGNGEIMIITLSCDLNGYEHDGRIDYEIQAKSEQGAIYSIDAGSFGTFIPKVEKDALKREGVDVAKLDYERTKYTYKLGVENSIWDKFEEKIKETYGKYDRKLTIIAVDIGSFTEHAVAFVKKIKNMKMPIFSVMGANEEIFTAKSRNETTKVYKLSERGDMFLLNVNIIKDRLASYIQLDSYVDDSGQMKQPEFYMNFPEYDAKLGKYTYRNYFAHYEAEHKKEKKAEGVDTRYLWEKKRQGIQNHFFDVAVYNVFCDIFMADWICSNNNPFKVQKYGNKPITSSWENACRLIKESSSENNIPLS